MAEDPDERLGEHLMLPILIEQELDPQVQPEQRLVEAIRGQLQPLIEAAYPVPADLLEQLLRQRRILVIVDHLSEMSEATRDLIRPERADFPAGALIVTSRIEEKLDGVPRTALAPLRVEWNRLSTFMEAYLTQRGKRDRFKDSEYFDACGRLSKMVGDRKITVLLAKLFAEQMISAKEGGDGELPANIPDLMLSYLNELNRNAAGDGRTNASVHQDAKVVGWQCLCTTFRPMPARRQIVIKELGGTDAEERLAYLEERLRLVRTIPPAEDEVRVVLDPLAEYLAGLYLVEHHGTNRKGWTELLAQADGLPTGPEGVKGFLLALRDCCLAKGVDPDLRRYLSDELGTRAGLGQGA
jgi:hypothetical protein